MLHKPDNSQRNQRDWFNPLRGLDMRKVVMLLEQWRRGDTTEFQWTIDLVEQLDPIVRASKRNLIDGIVELDWDVKTVAANKLKPGQENLAMEQTEALRAEYETIDNLEDAIEHMAEAEFHGVSHCEIWRASDGGPVLHLECVPPWHFHKVTGTGPWLYDADAMLGRQTGVDLPAQDWLIREVKAPIGPIELVLYVKKSMSDTDWDGFLATYGNPFRYAILPEGISESEMNLWLARIEATISGSSGAFPHGTVIESMTSGAGQEQFSARLGYLNEQLAIACLGSSLTMLSKSGSGTLAGNAHADTLQGVIRSLARRISVGFRKRLDVDMLTRLFPNQPQLAYFSLCYEAEPDAESYLSQAKQVHNLGYSTDPAQIQERTSLRLIESPLSQAFGPRPPLGSETKPV